MLLQMAKFCYFLWWSFIPTYTYVYTHTPHIHITYTYHVFIHSSVDGHLHCTMPWLLWIMLLWTLECMYFFKKVFLFTLDIPRSKTTGSHGRCILFLWGTSVLFSTVTELIYISIGGFTFLHILTKICFLCSFWW